MKKQDPIDKLLKEYRDLMPKTVVLMKNTERYEEVKNAIQEISDLVLDVDDTATINVSPDLLTGSAMMMTISSDIITIQEIDKFCEALKKANNCEIVGRTDGTVEFDATFQDVFVPAPPHK